MTDNTTRAHRAIALLVAACALCCGCSILQPRPAGTVPVRRPATTSPATPASAPPAATRGFAALLPVSPARLERATVLAARFAAAYQTWSWRRPPAAWLAGLRPETASELYAALTRAAAIPGILAQRDATRQAATGTATAVRIRDLARGSVTIIVTVRQVITGASRTSRATASFAITLTPHGNGWAVYDIEPASAGNR